MIKIEIISNKSKPQKKAILDIAKSLPDFFTSQGLSELKQKLQTHFLVGAYEADKLVGFITLRKSDTRALELSWLAVLKSYQGRGIGYNLVKTTLNNFAKQGFKMVYVKTLASTYKDAGYAKTRKFYKSLGFNTLEIIDPYPGWTDNPCQLLAVSLPLKA